jgi:hypothetical protein
MLNYNVMWTIRIEENSSCQDCITRMGKIELLYILIELQDGRDKRGDQRSATIILSWSAVDLTLPDHHLTSRGVFETPLGIPTQTTKMNNNAIATAESDAGPVVDRGLPNATTASPLDGVSDSDKILSQLHSRIDLSQVQSITVEREPDPERTENCPFTNYLSFRVGMIDPSMGVRIKEILLRNQSCIVYIDEKSTLQW